MPSIPLWRVKNDRPISNANERIIISPLTEKARRKAARSGRVQAAASVFLTMR